MYLWGPVRDIPEDKDEEHEEGEEDRDVVHGPEHDDELPAEVGEEAHQLEDAEEAEGAEDGDAGPFVVDAVSDRRVDLEHAVQMEEEEGGMPSVRVIKGTIFFTYAPSTMFFTYKCIRSPRGQW